MATKRANSNNTPSNRRRPALDPEGRENQLIAAAIDLAEKQIQEGTASSQVITHYLKLGSKRGRLEEERLERENELLREKVSALASAKRVEELYEQAINAVRAYAGQPPLTDSEDDGFYD